VRVTRASARGTGNLVVLYGATTGRDGIGGASVLASQELGDGSDEKRPSVQIGDPFTGKKLIEASLELVEGGLVASLQDCGAAGLASALAEMSSREAGVDVSLDLVPLREPDLEPWEIMISESQERMVAVVQPERLAEVETVLDKWELHHAAIGTVTSADAIGELRCFFHGDLEGAIPAAFLTDECPRYEVEQEPQPARARRPPARENLESKAWIYEQYDQLVQSRTVRRPGFGAAVLRLRPSYRGLAVSLDGPPVGELDPFAAGAGAVFAAARKVACAGGRPLALTDCLNFGNPEKPEIGWELAQAIEGIAQSAEALEIPVVSGNVSLYNETDGRAIPPTPVVGCVGIVEDVRTIPAARESGETLLLAEADASVASQAALVEFLWRSAPILSFARPEGDSVVVGCTDPSRLDWPSLRVIEGGA
jgi:phosphoribosylformylglycinamidine synthase